ncbi:MAG: NCS2 family permease [Salinisphaera sp.]|jgi:AGZA family xanthine/uracil permease-like MFS transporter|nr:NCS2 family permease [Salinisphaera sp.]
MADSTSELNAKTRGGNGDAVARFFEFEQEGTNYRREIIGGMTTFLAMAYIMFVNPTILSAAGMDANALFTATALSAIVGCLLMAFVARYPVAIAPSMGLNAFFAYSVVLGMGVSWQTALVGVLISGILFVLITVLKLREMILDAIPKDLKMASACGIGLFIAFIGFKDSGMVVANKATLVTLGNLTTPGTLLTIFGLVASVVFMQRRLPGAIFFGMILTSIAGIVTGYIPTPDHIVSAIPSVAPLFGVAITHLFSDPGDVFTLNLLVVVLTFLFVEFFDTAGTLMAVASKAGLIEGNKIKRAGPALLADSSSIVAAAIIGTSPTTSFIESTAGVASGARTGFASVITALFFVLALFFSPLLHVVTANVTAPALIIVGVLMVSSLDEIQWKRFEIAVPAFLMMIAMPLTYSIANGIALGLALYPLTMTVAGRGRELHPILYIQAVVFVLYFAFLT